MIRVFKPILPLDKQQREDNAKAETARNKANIDYVAMMCDVDIPTEDTQEA